MADLLSMRVREPQSSSPLLARITKREIGDFEEKEPHDTRNESPVEDRAAWIRTCIEEFAASEANRLNESTQEPAWGKPLIGFSRGDDPLYEKIKNE